MHIFVSMCLDLYSVCVYMHIMYVCAFLMCAFVITPHNTYPCVLSYIVSLDRACLKPQSGMTSEHSQRLAAQLFPDKAPGCKHHQRTTNLSCIFQ